MPRKPLILVGAVVVALFASSSARAAPSTLECGLAAEGVIVVDGLADDWKGVTGVRVEAHLGGDAALRVRCNYGGERLYLFLDVTDDKLVRTAKAGADEDHLVLSFADARLEVHPADAAHRVPRKVRWATGGKTDGIAIADTLLPDGWAVELAMPLARTPGWGPGAPALRFVAELVDADAPATITRVSAGGGMLSFAEGAETTRRLLALHDLGPQDLVLDTLAEMDGEPGLERVLAGGRIIGIVGRDYSYLDLPVASAKDLAEVRVVDLAGEGKASIVTRYVERGGGGSREVLAVWNVMPDGSLARTFAHEIGKQLGAQRLANEWSLAPAQQAKKAVKGSQTGWVLVIRPGAAVGVSADSWHEAPTEEMQPILLPWGEHKEEVWTFHDNEAFGGETSGR